MTKNSLLAACIVCIAYSCNNDKADPPVSPVGDSANGQEMKIMIPSSGCYAAVSGKDSFYLKTEIFPNVVTGNLSYNFYEKDDNKGEIEGVLKGDTLYAYYTFSSEAVKSVREVAFLIKDKEAIEGYGDMQPAGDTMKFKNRSTLNFSGDIRWTKIDCNQ